LAPLVLSPIKQGSKTVEAKHNPTDDTALLTKLNDAVAAANEAEAKVTTAQAELISRSRTVGLLLLEAKKLHPAVKDFQAFLKRVDGLKLSRAYDLMKLAGGRTTDEELRKETRDRVKKHRASKKLPRPTPEKPEAKPDLKPISVTSGNVTESASAEISIEQRRAENADLDLSAEERAAKASARALTEFTVACRTWLPKMIEADHRKARLLVSELTNVKAEAA
jgi:hypothetical protein